MGALQGGILDRGACDKSHRIERSSTWGHPQRPQDPSLCEDAPVIITAAALAARRLSSRALGYHTARQEEAPIHATAGHHPSLRLAANRVFHGRTPMIDGCSRGGGSRGGGDAHGCGAGHNGQLGSGSNVDTKVCKAVPVPLHLPPHLPATLHLPLFSRRRRSICALPYNRRHHSCAPLMLQHPELQLPVLGRQLDLFGTTGAMVSGWRRCRPSR